MTDHEHEALVAIARLGIDSPAAYLRYPEFHAAVELACSALARSFYRPDGTWECTTDGVSTPCGHCDGCRGVEAGERARTTVAETGGGWLNESMRDPNPGTRP